MQVPSPFLHLNLTDKLQKGWKSSTVGPADTLREHHASSSNTRLFPVEMSRARKSSETICPVRFCGPPQQQQRPGRSVELT